MRLDSGQAGSEEPLYNSKHTRAEGHTTDMVNLKHRQWLYQASVRIKAGILLTCIFLAGLSSTATGSSPRYSTCRTYWGSNDYIEYIAGDLPIVISAPHGGYLEPPEIPGRTCGDQVETDDRTQELTREVSAYIRQKTGQCPHVVINKLHRNRLDANRDIGEAACGSPISEQSWREYHAFIDTAGATITTQYGNGLYLDLHSNIDYADRWVELGFLLDSADLARSDATLSLSQYKDKSSVKSLAYTPGIYFPEIIRGGNKFGRIVATTRLQVRSQPSLPRSHLVQ